MINVVKVFLTIFLGLGLGVVAQEKGVGEMKEKTVSAFICDHRYGAQATWSQGTDTAQLKSFWWAEACAFRENLALTVFDNPFSVGGRFVPVSERREAAYSGRLGFQLYFTTDRWAHPQTGKFEIIPDYYDKVWTKKAVAAGFTVVPGEAKCSRFPNHGQQMFDSSDGRYGYDVKNGKKGREDVFTALLKHETDWLAENFGPCSVAAYRNGQTGAFYAMSRHLLGARNSGCSGDLSYGRSAQDKKLLGVGRYPDLTLANTASMVLTTRAGDINASREAVTARCQIFLQQAIATHGWYRDFIHWHTSPRFGLSLEQFLADQRKIMKGADVVSLDFGQALQHKFLRDISTVAVHEADTDIQLDVTFSNSPNLPLSVFQIPLSVGVNLTGTRFAGQDFASPEGCAIRRLAKDQFVVDVPFAGHEGMVTVHLQPTTVANYVDLERPSVEQAVFLDGRLLVQTDKPTRLVVFASPAGKGIRGVRAVARSHELSSTHAISLNLKAEEVLFVGAITQWKQSVLVGPLPLKEELSR